MKRKGSPWGIFPFAQTAGADAKWDWNGAQAKLQAVNAVRAQKGLPLSNAKPPMFSKHVLAALAELSKGPKRQSSFNPGVVQKLLREKFVVMTEQNYLVLTGKGKLYSRSTNNASQ